MYPNHIYNQLDPNKHILESNIPELQEKDREYTKKAQSEGKPYYLWDTNIMAAMILNDAIEENNESEPEYNQTAYWLALYLKFIDNQEIIELCLDYYNKGLRHFNKEIYGQTIYMLMRDYTSGYLFALCYAYIDNNKLKRPTFLLRYKMLHAGILERKVSEDGHSLIKCTTEESQKACGVWISPEENERIKKQLEIKLQKYKEELYKKGELPEIYLKDIKPD